LAGEYVDRERHLVNHNKPKGNIMRKVGIVLIVLALIFYAEKERLLGWDAFYNPNGVGGDWERGSNTGMRDNPHCLDPGVFYNPLTWVECGLITFVAIGTGVILICRSRQKKSGFTNGGGRKGSPVADSGRSGARDEMAGFQDPKA
jgi:hypothetical protein